MIYLAQWSDSTSWPDVSSINGGQEYTAADGIIFDDFNKVVRALLWLKEQGGASGGGTVGDIVFADDGKGNVTVSVTGGGSLEFIDDGNGNITMEVT